MDNQETTKRWYEQDSKIAVSVQLIMKFPVELQQVIFEGVDLLVKRELKNTELANQYKTLGQEKVLAVFKSKQRKRYYDHVPEIHKAMNQIMVLPEDDQAFIAGHIIDLVKMIKEYFEAQLDSQQSSVTTKNDVKQLTDTYVKEGDDKARQYLEVLKQKFMASVEKREAETPGHGSRHALKGSDADLKIYNTD